MTIQNQLINERREAIKREELYNKALRMSFLYEEIDLIQKKIKPEDCGHLKTAVNVLREQLRELKAKMQLNE